MILFIANPPLKCVRPVSILWIDSEAEQRMHVVANMRVTHAPVLHPTTASELAPKESQQAFGLRNTFCLKFPTGATLPGPALDFTLSVSAVCCAWSSCASSLILIVLSRKIRLRISIFAASSPAGLRARRPAMPSPTVNVRTAGYRFCKGPQKFPLFHRWPVTLP
jgi:hypothetical protein